MQTLDSPAAANGEKQSKLAQCVRERLAGVQLPTDLPPASAAIFSAYQAYWRAAMSKTDVPAQLEAQLLASLNAIPAMARAPDRNNLAVMSDYAVAAIAQRS